MKGIGLSALAAVMLAAFAQTAVAEVKVGFVNSDRVMKEAPPAKKAQQKLEGMQEALEKNGMTMAEGDRRNKEREFNELNRDFQRKQREFREDLNQRRNEELAGVLERANKTIKQIAEAEKYDIIFQEAVYASPRIDITDKVIKALIEAK